MSSRPECLAEIACVDLTDVDKVYLLQFELLTRV